MTCDERCCSVERELEASLCVICFYVFEMAQADDDEIEFFIFDFNFDGVPGLKGVIYKG